MSTLKTNIQYLPGVGEKRAKILKQELNIVTIEDLLFTFPYKYIDKTKFYKINELNYNLPYIQVKGKITNLRIEGQKFKKRLIATFIDDTGKTELIWFKGIKWIKDSIKINTEYVIFGKPSKFGNKINIVHPDMELSEIANSKINTALEPAYSISEKLKKNYITSKVILKLMQAALKLCYANIAETLSDNIINKHNLLSLKQALLNIHFPKNADYLAKAQLRLKFEELFYIQLKLVQQKMIVKTIEKGYVFKTVGNTFNEFYKNNLKFELTNAQKKVIKEINADFKSGQHMNRLLQGDVGSGKTLVALLSMLIAIDNGFQACLMAPTEILAIQHFNTISNFLKNINVKITLLTGSTKQKDRTILHKELQNGEINILIGTHALIEDTVKFKNLGFVVIDEQHRFGVAQRAKMWKKNTMPPHILVMTATPIPRTLAMTVYGDLDVSIIDELPPGRKPVKTIHVFENKRDAVFKSIKQKIAEGRQVYIVYPLIKESDHFDYKDLEDGYDDVIRYFPLPQYKVSIVHGQMKPADKDIEMKKFIKGITNIMVATTVIEVGVDVPNASVMVIESAEKFGLSQLHQLRGRVGRGAEQSYCILITSHKLTTEGRKRISTMVETNDGFEIAEVDMKLRGPGDIDGTMQSGIPFNLRIANLAKDNSILLLARDTATQILKNDIKLQKNENLIIAQKLKNIIKNDNKWSNIS